ncbi:T9SS type A sorting domain-containing protein [Lacibacter sediminis]|uniref:T9SS type A sorting domain-containing protein n=1 Tax=Lacibacter sediminis TaxID=2760713 RepID=A0A7G5XIF7_9BACT|nr:T9SS type A sorting domain-containing protein [Lacibacter sediminis]QNA45260.1 T9SS type A sorting domain-containing protein [Lacibacter sediminis]
MKIIQNIWILAALLCYQNTSNAQQVSIKTISSGGTFGSSNNLMIEYSVGEFISTSLIGGSTTLTQGVLQPYIQLQSPLPVLGLEFNAKRINNSKVQLDWKTVQEIDNKGFYVERKKESDINFTQIHFVKSTAANGNSSLRLNYVHIDTNSFRGKTYYRLKQEDFDGKFMYSVVRLVNGNNGKVITMKAWPVPAVSNFNVSIQGITNVDALQLFDVNGRLVKTVPISNQLTVNIRGLTPGTYVLRLASDANVSQKVIIQ